MDDDGDPARVAQEVGHGEGVEGVGGLGHPAGVGVQHRHVAGVVAVVPPGRVPVTAGAGEVGGAFAVGVDVEAVELRQRRQPGDVGADPDPTSCVLGEADLADHATGLVAQDGAGRVRGERHADDGAVERRPAGASREAGVTVGEDPAVRRRQVVPTTTGRRGHGHDRLVEWPASLAAVEAGRAVGEDAAVAGHHPVAGGGRGASEVDHAAGVAAPGVTGRFGGGVGAGHAPDRVPGGQVGVVVAAVVDDDGHAPGVGQQLGHGEGVGGEARGGGAALVGVQHRHVAGVVAVVARTRVPVSPGRRHEVSGAGAVGVDVEAVELRQGRQPVDGRPHLGPTAPEVLEGDRSHRGAGLVAQDRLARLVRGRRRRRGRRPGGRQAAECHGHCAHHRHHAANLHPEPPGSVADPSIAGAAILPTAPPRSSGGAAKRR